MQTLSPNLDRLGAALKALRQTHDHNSEDKTALGAKCLAVLISQLAEDGLAQEDLQPLIDLAAALRSQSKTDPGAANRRKGAPPSDALLARITAVIDVLVKAGYEEGDAAQMLMRRMLAVGVTPPLKGGDARGWKRMLAWRSDLIHGLGSAEAREEYQVFTRQLEAMPPGERLKCAIDDQVWDRRRNLR